MALIEEATMSCNSILSHFHYVIGQKPLHLNWDEPKSKDMVENDPRIVQSMKELQSYIQKLSKWYKSSCPKSDPCIGNQGFLGRKACNLYEDGDPYSVEFTISSKLFEGKEVGCIVEGFY